MNRRQIGKDWQHQQRGEAGSMTPLIIAFTFFLATLVAVVVDASAAYLRRQNLNALADSAALSATDGLQGTEVYDGGLAKRARIDPVAADRYVQDYLARSGARASYPGLQVRVSTLDNVVTVRLSAPIDLPLNVPRVGPRPVIGGEASSEVQVSD